MAESSIPGLGDVFNFLGGGLTRSFGQFQRGVTDFLKAVENFQRTMEQFHQLGVRVNALLDEVEGPLRAAVPALTRVVNTADGLLEPVQRLTPGIGQLAETLSHPLVVNLPQHLGEFMDSISDVVARLRPLGQLAETAGGLFGLRSLTSRGAPPTTSTPDAAASPATAQPAPPAKRKPTRKTAKAAKAPSQPARKAGKAPTAPLRRTARA